MKRISNLARVVLCFFLIFSSSGCGSSRYISSKRPTEFCSSKSDIKYNIIKTKFEYEEPFFHQYRAVIYFGGELRTKLFQDVNICDMHNVPFMITVDNSGSPSGLALRTETIFPNCDSEKEEYSSNYYESFVRVRQADGNRYVDYKEFNILTTDIIMDKAIELYPDHFSRDSSSLPIEIIGKITVSDSRYSMAFYEIITLCLLGGIFPLPMSEYFDIDLNISAGKSVSTDLINVSDTFKVEGDSWFTLLTPLGSFDVPGPSDLPKSKFNYGLGTKTCAGIPQMRELTKRSIIYSIVDAICKKDSSQ